MLNANCKYPFQLVKEVPDCPEHGGLVLPTPYDPGTGNIVIRGKAGTGKSTLALQILSEAARRNDGIFGAYISLEEDQAQVFRKAQNCGWSPYVWPVSRLFDPKYRPDIDTLVADLEKTLDQPMQCHTCGQELAEKDRGKKCAAATAGRPCPFLERCRTAKDDIDQASKSEFTAFPGKVILPQLEPRTFSRESADSSDDSLFWTRYQQLDDLLQAAKKLRDQGNADTTELDALCSAGSRVPPDPAAKVEALAVALRFLCRAAAKVFCALGERSRRYETSRGELSGTLRSMHSPDGTADKELEAAIRALGSVTRAIQNGNTKRIAGERLTRLEKCIQKARKARRPASEQADSLKEALTKFKATFEETLRDDGCAIHRCMGYVAQLKKGLPDLLQAVHAARRPTDVQERQGRERLNKAFKSFVTYCQEGGLAARPAKEEENESFRWMEFTRCLGEFRTWFGQIEGELDEDTGGPDDGDGAGFQGNCLWPSGPFDKSLAIVCIDSLNVLGTGGLTRDHLAALFDLFKRRQVIGVFVVEENEHGTFAGDSPIDSDTIDFLSDMVIDLTATEEQGYYVRHFQIAKSRYQKHILGKHPYKIEGKSSDGALGDPLVPSKHGEQVLSNLVQGQFLRIDQVRGGTDWKSTARAEWRRRAKRTNGVRPFPSVHAIVAASEHLSGSGQGRAQPGRQFWSEPSLQDMVGNDFSMSGSAAKVIAVTGPATTGKSLIAGNFLLQGLDQGEDVLLIRLAEEPRFSADGSYTMKDEMRQPSGGLRKLPEDDTVYMKLRDYLSSFDKAKIHWQVKAYRREDRLPNGKRKPKPILEDPVLVEIAMQPGALLPEQFLDIVRTVYKWQYAERKPRDRGFGIRRVALVQVGAIGVSYPLLHQSSTSADLFLPSLAHMLRCRGTDFIMTGQTGGVPQSEEMVRKAESMADSVISCQHCDVFGDRYITVTGPGLIEKDLASGHTPETVPGVLRRRKSGKNDFFEIKMETLRGLVGFSTGHIRRPGISLQLFEEGVLHREYNRQVSRLVEFAMGNSCPGNEQPVDAYGGDQYRGACDLSKALDLMRGQTPDPEAPTVAVDTFGSIDAASFHSSLRLLHDAPLHNTVLRTVDEHAVLDLLDIGSTSETGPSNAHGAKPVRDDEQQEQKPRIQRFLYSMLYYRNVLMFACDEDTHRDLRELTDLCLFPEDKDLAGQELEEAKKQMGRERKKNIGKFWDAVVRLKSENLEFISDFRAPETLSCLAMDGVLALAEWRAPREDGNPIEIADLYDKDGGGPLARSDLESYLRNLREILPSAVPLMDRKTGTLDDRVSNALGNKESRFLILGWYSHIREMIGQFMDRRPTSSEEANKRHDCLRVLALPGGGFTGDWYLHVPSGSVSESLGMQARDVLLEPAEDFRRFMEGVGLPCWPHLAKDFHGRSRATTGDPEKDLGKGSSAGADRERSKARTKDIASGVGSPDQWQAAERRFVGLQRHAWHISHQIAAWPGAPEGVTLESVLRIHNRANLRSRLRGYTAIHGELAGIMQHIRAGGKTAGMGVASPNPDECVLGLLQRGMPKSGNGQ
jgi:KaiC/GvpD/RAD55 family RecA-like ATPase